MYRLFFLCLLAACQSPTPSGNKDQAGNSGVHFQFSNAAREAELQDTRNWCTHSLHEAIRLDAGSGDANRRVFALGSGVHRVVVDAGGRTASLMLKKNTGSIVDVFTSANFPICLSDRTSFLLQPEDGILHYNGKHIQFTVKLEERPNGLVVELEMAPGAGYGFLVHRCEDCQ